MELNKIYNKRCFIKRADGKVYCSKCGSVILQDSYNMKKHAKECGFSRHDFEKIYLEGKEFVCGWKEKEGRLCFGVYTPKLIVRPGFSDKYIGGTWVCVYKCYFSLEEKKLEEVPGGLQNIQYWKKKELETLNLQSTGEIINRYFHTPVHKNLAHFVDIYLGRGFTYEELFSEEHAKEILKQDREIFPEMTQVYNSYVGFIRGRRVYAESDGRPVLSLTVKKAGEETLYQFLIGKNYLFAEEVMNIDNLFIGKFLCSVPERHLQEFIDANPQMGIMNYWKESKANLLLPLLSPYYDEKLELLSKAGCATLAEQLYYFEKSFGEIPRVNGDLKKWLGLPVKIIRKLHMDCMRMEDCLAVLSEIYKSEPEYLDVEKITYALLQFLKQNVLAEKYKQRTDIVRFHLLDKKVKLRMARYLGTSGNFFMDWRTQRDYGIYVDYLNVSRRVGDYVGGYTPEDLELAHDMAVDRYRGTMNAFQEIRFRETVTSEEYIRLETEMDDEEEEFFICAPKSTRDMQLESERLHHCVRIYCGRVASKETAVYFLRTKKNPKEPFATIEVQNGAVVQLKAKYNRQVSSAAQEYVRKWAAEKKLTIQTMDIDGIAV